MKLKLIRQAWQKSTTKRWLLLLGWSCCWLAAAMCRGLAPPTLSFMDAAIGRKPTGLHGCSIGHHSCLPWPLGAFCSSHTPSWARPFVWERFQPRCGVNLEWSNKQSFFRLKSFHAHAFSTFSLKQLPLKQSALYYPRSLPGTAWTTLHKLEHLGVFHLITRSQPIMAHSIENISRYQPICST